MGVLETASGMDPVVGVIIGSIIAALSTYFIAVRKLSGRIATTEAAQLWEESNRIREEYRAQLAISNERVVDLEKRVAGIEAHNYELTVDNLRLRNHNAELEKTVGDLQTRIFALEEENTELKSRVTSLQHLEERRHE